MKFKALIINECIFFALLNVMYEYMSIEEGTKTKYNNTRPRVTFIDFQTVHGIPSFIQRATKLVAYVPMGI